MNDTTLSNQPMDELARLSLAAREALTDSMVERIAITGAAAFELIDRLNDPQTGEAVHRLLDRLTELNKVGALDTVFDLVMLLHGARNALTDNMVERLFTFFEQMINTVGNEAMGELADNTRLALDEAAEEAAAATPRGGVMAMLATLSKPETQRSLQFLLAFSDKLQKHTTGVYRPLEQSPF
jgi:uncharacterized protein YjgD (DUF1641 family)